MPNATIEEPGTGRSQNREAITVVKKTRTRVAASEGKSRMRRSAAELACCI